MERRRPIAELGCPAWMARAEIYASSAIALAALAQRWGRIDLVLVAVVVAAAAATAFHRGPFWLRAAVVLTATAVVMMGWRANGDLMPFLVLGICLKAGFVEEVVPGGVVMAACAVVLVGLDLVGHYHGSSSYAVGAVLAWFAGWGLYELSSLLAELTEAQAGLVETAALEERRRVAAELHDVIAHSLAVTILQVTGARLALEADDREDALEALREAERTGRSSLNDVRRSVGLLGYDAATRPPEPTAVEIPDLVDELRNAGLRVDLAVEGRLEDVAPSGGLCCCRIIQESLANAVKHATGAPVAVRMKITSTGTQVIVRNDVSEAAVLRMNNGRILSTHAGVPASGSSRDPDAGPFQARKPGSSGA